MKSSIDEVNGLLKDPADQAEEPEEDNQSDDKNFFADPQKNPFEGTFLGMGPGMTPSAMPFMQNPVP